MSSRIASPITFTAEFIGACRVLWQDGYDKGVNGTDDYPDFSSFFSNIKTPSFKKDKEEPSYGEMSDLPFNPCKCEARVEKHGYAIQCTRSPFEGRSLCKTHQNMFDKLPEGKDIPYGRFNQPRPDLTLDKGNPISWGPKKSRKKSPSEDQNKPKLKVGEMRDYLSSRIPNTVFKHMKKKELMALYLSEKEKDNSTPKSPSPEINEGEDTQIESSSQVQPEQPTEENTEKPEEKPEQPEEKPEKPEETTGQLEEKPEQPEEQPKEQLEEQCDDGTGVGLNLEISVPKTISEFKTLFRELNIDTTDIKGKRQYKQAYDDYLKSKLEEEEENTQPMSDEDDDELQADMNTYEETTFDGVSYLEDEDSGKIYNLKHQHVGKWNSNIDDILWLSEEFKTDHENSRP